jgi:hypothetical protein
LTTHPYTTQERPWDNWSSQGSRGWSIRPIVRLWTLHYSPALVPTLTNNQRHSADYGDAKEADIVISKTFLRAIESAFGPEAQDLYRQMGGDFLFY